MWFRFLLFTLLALEVKGQAVNTDTIFQDRQGAVLNQKLFSDSLCSSFFLSIDQEVKAHKHLFHSEHVYVVKGSGEMTLGEKTFSIHEGMVIFIPEGIVHSVKVTKGPLRVISIQAPFFDGKDRVFVK